MEDKQKDIAPDEKIDAAASEVIFEKIDAAEAVDSTFSANTEISAVSSANGFSKKAFIVIIILLTAITIGTAFSIYMSVKNSSKTNSIIEFISVESGKDLNALIESGQTLGDGHPEYDDKAVVEAYKTGDASKLSEKDKYVYETAKAAIDEVITEDMSDYEKELAIYNWIFHHTHYNNEAFVDVTRSADITLEQTSESESLEEPTVDRNKNTNEENSEPLPYDDKIASSDPYGENYDYEPYGVLKFKTAICVGNATTFKLFMDMLDIPCKIIHSTEEGEHAWNLVKIGGDWYHVDITFDDGFKTPSYANFNVTDNVKLGTYPWDTTDFPAANATKYSYIAQNAIEVDNIYEVPALARKALDNNQTYLYLKGKNPGTLSISGIDEITSYLQNYYKRGSFYSTQIYLTEDTDYYQLQLIPYSEDTADMPSESGAEVEIDYDKLSNAMTDAFKDLAVG